MKNTINIYSNYDLWDNYSSAAYSMLEDMNARNEEPLTSEVWNVAEELAAQDWVDEKESLTKYFDGKILICTGTLGLWNGNFAGGDVGSFEELMGKAMKDCDFWEFTDEAGHLKLKCTHHDGTNEFEFRILTKQGEEYYDNWQYGYDNRTKRHVHSQIVNHYSVLPHYAKNVYGTREYVRQTA